VASRIPTAVRAAPCSWQERSYRLGLLDRWRVGVMADRRPGYGSLSRITGMALTRDLALLLFGVSLEQEPQQALQPDLVLRREPPDDLGQPAGGRLRRWRGTLQRCSTRSLAPPRLSWGATDLNGSLTERLASGPMRRARCAHRCCEGRARCGHRCWSRQAPRARTQLAKLWPREWSRSLYNADQQG
jgi:hypothetical protein